MMGFGRVLKLKSLVLSEEDSLVEDRLLLSDKLVLCCDLNRL